MKSPTSNSFFYQPLIILRIWLGIAFIMHGLPGIFSADYMAGHIGMLELYGIPLPEFTAYLSKGGELIGGVLMLLGLFTRMSAIVIMINMMVATFIALRGDIFGDFQAEMSFTYLLIALVIFFKGPTDFSIDNWMKQRSSIKEMIPTK